MLKRISLFIILIFMFSCSEPIAGSKSNTYPEEPFFTVVPYPLIEINPGKVVIGTCRPGVRSDSILVTGFENGQEEFPAFAFLVMDTLSPTDLIPNDNVFHFEIKSTEFPLSQNFTMKVAGYANGIQMWSDMLDSIQTVANNQPQITFLQVNDTLTSDSTTWTWSLHAFDPDPDEELRIEILAEFSTGWKKIEEYVTNFALAGNFEIDAKFDSTARAGLIGESKFRFVVFDHLSNFVEDTVSTFVVNSAPHIKQLIFPDTLKILPSTPSNSLYLIQVSDAQTIADIDSVNILFYRPDSSFSLLVDWFNDDGEDPDNISADGWFSALIPNPNNPENDGKWILKVYVKDKAGNKSIIKTTFLTLRN